MIFIKINLPNFISKQSLIKPLVKGYIGKYWANKAVHIKKGTMHTLLKQR